MNERRKVIVTGLSGLLGSRMVRLVGDTVELVNVDITEGIDITDLRQLRGAIEHHTDAGAVVHLAAFTDVSAAYAQTDDENGLCYRVNVVGTRNVAAVCTELGLHLVHVSTDFVFDGRKDGAYTEQDTPNPIEWYGHTKLKGEKAVRTASSWTIVRIAFPYVAGGVPRPDLVRNIYSRLAGGQETHLFTDQTITPTFADDIVNGLMLLTKTRPGCELFHLVGSSSLSPFELGLEVADVFGLDRNLVRPSSLIEYIETDPRPRQQRLELNNAKWTAFATDHGLDPPLTIDTGLARVRDQMNSD